MKIPFLLAVTVSILTLQAPAQAQNNELPVGNNDSQIQPFNGAGGTADGQPMRRHHRKRGGGGGDLGGGGAGLSEQDKAMRKQKRKERMLKRFDKDGDGTLNDAEQTEAQAFRKQKREQMMNARNAGGTGLEANSPLGKHKGMKHKRRKFDGAQTDNQPQTSQ